MPGLVVVIHGDVVGGDIGVLHGDARACAATVGHELLLIDALLDDRGTDADGRAEGVVDRDLGIEVLAA